MLTLILQKYDDQPIDLMDDDLIMFEYEPDNTIQFSDDIRTSSTPSTYAYTPWELA
jgi:hypothetical protein